jgi:hypothetical protein
MSPDNVPLLSLFDRIEAARDLALCLVGLRTRLGQGDGLCRSETHFTALLVPFPDEHPTLGSGILDTEIQAFTIGMEPWFLERLNGTRREAIHFLRHVSDTG